MNINEIMNFFEFEKIIPVDDKRKYDKHKNIVKKFNRVFSSGFNEDLGLSENKLYSRILSFHNNISVSKIYIGDVRIKDLEKILNSYGLMLCNVRGYAIGF